MAFQRFERHEDMNPETLDEIMEILNSPKRLPFGIKNSLFGLFDGFLYDDLLPEAKEKLSPELAQRIEDVINTVKQYPTLK